MSKNNEIGICLILGILFALVISPLIYTAFFAVPAVDDYSFGYPVHIVWESTHSVALALAAAAKETLRLYKGWQGTFSAIFLMCLQPAVFKEEFYPAVTFIMMGALISSCLFFCRAMFHNIFGAKKSVSYIIALVWLTLCIQLLPSPVESFYWFNGSVYYTFFFSLSLFLYGNMCIWLKNDKKICFAVMCLLCAVIGGGNYVTALVSMLVFALIIFILIISKSKKRSRLIIPFAILAVSFLINALAPGNAVRQSQFAQPDAIKAIMESFCAAGEYAVKWMSLPLAACILCISPILVKIAADSDFSFKLVLLVPAVSFALYAAQFCPSLYAMSEIGPDRMMNIIYFFFVFAVLFNVFYIIGALTKLFHIKSKKNITKRLNTVIAIFMCAAFAGVCYISTSWDSMTTVEAIRSLKNHEPQKFKSQNDKRLELLKDPSAEDIVFEPYEIKPRLLFTDDLRPDSSDWLNETVADWYGKTSIIRRNE